MTKLLAALNLPQVGEVSLVQSPDLRGDEVGCASDYSLSGVSPRRRASGAGVLSIHLDDRDYLLKASDPATAEQWVQVLNVLKEGMKGASPCRELVPRRRRVSRLAQGTRCGIPMTRGRP